jgi:DNA invertase Pin-like site-specific DNA recombinase
MPRRKGGAVAVEGVDYAAVKDILIPYRRVSTREQADSGAGLAAQRTTISMGLAMRQQQALDWESGLDRGRSGKDMNRKGLIEALSLVKQGKAGGIIVSKLDRLSRSLLDFAFLMSKADKEGWNIVALDLGVDLSTPAGKAMAGMLAVFAQFERDVIRQRTLDGLAEKRAEGVILGRRSALDDDMIGAIFALFHGEGGYSPAARFLNDAGVMTPQGAKRWYPASVREVMLSANGQRVIKGMELV